MFTNAFVILEAHFDNEACAGERDEADNDSDEKHLAERVNNGFLRLKCFSGKSCERQANMGKVLLL